MSIVLATAGVVLILIGIIGGGFTYLNVTMPRVGKLVRTGCLMVGGIFLLLAISLFAQEPRPGSGRQLADAVGDTPPAVGIIRTSDGSQLRIFSAPSTQADVTGTVADEMRVTVECTRHGEAVNGPAGISNLWDKINGGFVPDTFVATGTNEAVAPPCGD